MNHPSNKFLSHKKTWRITGVVIGILLIAVLLVFFFRLLFPTCSSSVPLSEAYYAEFDGNRFYYDLYSTQEGNPPRALYAYDLDSGMAECVSDEQPVNPLLRVQDGFAYYYNDNGIYRKNLQTGREEPVFQGEKGERYYSTCLIAEEDDLYFSLIRYEMEWDDVFEKISPSNKTSYIYHYNTDTGKIRKLMEYDCSKSLNHTLFHFYLRDSLLYYTVYTELHCINIETCTDSLLYDIHEWDFHINPTETGFSILTIDERNIIQLDWKGNVLSQSSVSGNFNYISPALRWGFNADQLCYYAINKDNYTLCQIPCSDPSDYTELCTVPLEYRNGSYDICYRDGLFLMVFFSSSAPSEFKSTFLKVENGIFTQLHSGFVYTKTLYSTKYT